MIYYPEKNNAGKRNGQEEPGLENFFKKDFMCSFLERGEEKEIERERDVNVFASRTPRTRV